MRSLWSDRDAEAIVARYGESGVATDLALRVYTSRLLGGDPRLVLHGGGNTSVKTVMPDLLGDPAEVLCVKGSGWDMAQYRAGGPARRPPRAAAQVARARRAVRRGHGARPARQPARSRRAEPVGRDAAARVSAAQIHRPHARDGGAEPRRPARRRRARRRSLRAAGRDRAVHHAGVSAGQEGGRDLRGRSGRRGSRAAEARRLQLRRHRARGLRAHDRDRDARRGAARARPQVGFRRREAAGRE